MHLQNKNVEGTLLSYKVTIIMKKAPNSEICGMQSHKCNDVPSLG